MQIVRGVITVAGRVMLCTIFLLAAVGNQIPHFHSVAEMMAKQGIPYPKVALVGAIVFLLVGSVSIIVGYKARLGALLLLIFLGLAAYYFHNFWAVADPVVYQDQMAHFLKNLSMMGAMLLIIAVGPGPMSLDRCGCRRSKEVESAS
jgi:putative oxidoreductase